MTNIKKFLAEHKEIYTKTISKSLYYSTYDRSYFVFENSYSCSNAKKVFIFEYDEEDFLLKCNTEYNTFDEHLQEALQYGKYIEIMK